MITISISSTPKPFWEADSEVCVETKREALVYLWALAHQDTPEYGSCWLPGAAEEMDNQGMGSRKIPCEFRDDAEERIDQLNRAHREAVLEADDLYAEFVCNGQIVRDKIVAITNVQQLDELVPGFILEQYSWIGLKNVTRWGIQSAFVPVAKAKAA